MPAWKFMEQRLLAAREKKYRIEGAECTTVWHRRAGKDSTAINFLGVAAHIRIGMYWHIFPTQELARKTIWDGVVMDEEGNGKRFLSCFPGFEDPGMNKPGIVKRVRQDTMLIEFKNGSMYQLVGSDKADLVGPNPVGVIPSEYSLQDPKAVALIEPILAENGGWKWYTYTPRGRNHGHRHYKAAKRSFDEGDPSRYCQLLTIADTKRADGTPVVKQAYVDKLIRENKMTPEQAEQEFHCSWDIGNEGAYFTNWIKQSREAGRWQAHFKWEPNIPVDTFWDLGRSDYMVIIYAQRISRNEVRVIDVDWSCGEDLRHYIKLLKQKPYVYGDHWAPHDITVTELTAKNQSRQDVARSLGVRFKIMRKVGSVQERIDATRREFHTVWFNNNCANITKDGTLQDALEGYAKKFNEKTATFSEQPDKTWHGHFADAFGGMCLVYSPDVPRGTGGQTKALDGWDPFNHVGHSDMHAPGYDELSYMSSQPQGNMGSAREALPAAELRRRKMAGKQHVRFFHGIDTDDNGHIIITGEETAADED